jgi:hypothetical protein
MNLDEPDGVGQQQSDVAYRVHPDSSGSSLPIHRLHLN